MEPPSHPPHPPGAVIGTAGPWQAEQKTSAASRHSLRGVLTGVTIDAHTHTHTHTHTGYTHVASIVPVAD